MQRILTTAATALALAAGGAAASAAAASAATYTGTTKGGHAIRFELRGKRVSAISTAVPTVCLETTGSGLSTAGAELFRPPGSFALGRTGRARALQPAAMNQGIKATKRYTVTTRAARRGKIAGRLALSFSYLRPGIDIYHSYIYACTGTTRFTARAR